MAPYEYRCNRHTADKTPQRHVLICGSNVCKNKAKAYTYTGKNWGSDPDGMHSKTLTLPRWAKFKYVI